MRDRSMPRSSLVALVLAGWSIAGNLIPAAAQEAAFLGKPRSRWTSELTSSDPCVRRSAAFALGRIGPAASLAVPQLVQALKDVDPNVRDAAAYALGEIGPAALEAFFPLLDKLANDREPRVRR